LRELQQLGANAESGTITDAVYFFFSHFMACWNTHFGQV
jgi:hypothetical protein